MTTDLQDLDEFFQNMRAGSNSELAWALEWTALRPLGNAGLTEELPAVVTLHRVNGDLETDAADKRVLKLLMHLAIQDSLDIVASRRKSVSLVTTLLVLVPCKVVVVVTIVSTLRDRQAFGLCSQAID